MGRYRIEIEGYNDGRPYEVSDCPRMNLWTAREELDRRRKGNPKVRHRLIEVLNDFA